MDTREFCMTVTRADTEEEVIRILRKSGYWDDPSAWKYYGDNENNFATIGNQQSSPEAALVEKIVNSVDAMLMRECLRNRIDPESKDAPQSVTEALELFFGVKGGLLTSITPSRRNELAQNIVVVASGKRSNPCYSIIDKGEGQTPTRMPRTFLSLTASNKLRIPFVQGKFNMGGTGALQFCGGHHNMQLVISKRDPKIVQLEGNDGSSDCWGFTVVRREDPAAGRRSSSFRYLAPAGEVLRFRAPELPLLPGEYPNTCTRPLESGTLVKLYDYQIGGGLKTAIILDLFYRLSELLPNIALPALLSERRPGYEAHTYHTILSGLNVRLAEDRGENVEQGFPSSSTVMINDQEMRILIHAFKPDKKRRYSSDGVIFTVNGQAHGFISKSFFIRGKIGLHYLADSILLLADCSRFEGRTREDLFMNSRDRLREGETKAEIENALEAILKSHSGLRELKERRRREEIRGRIGDSKPLAELLQKAIRTSPTLSKLFVQGIKLTNPFDLEATGSTNEFNGKQFPTFFRLEKELPRETPKRCSINRRFRVRFETDARNDYFTRDDYSGEFSIRICDQFVTDYSLNLWNGIATLSAPLPSNLRIGDIVEVKTTVSDITQINPFLSGFHVQAIKETVSNVGAKGHRVLPPDDEEGNGRKKPSGLALPNIHLVRCDDWNKRGFDRESALKVIDSGEEGYDFYINLDNIHLLTEIKNRHGVEGEILETEYQVGMVMLGMSLLNALEKEQESTDLAKQESVYDIIGRVSRAFSPFLLPMISTLGELETE